jgi:NADPH:quinone reductase-like Zn-dependent oxidoreductase
MLTTTLFSAPIYKDYGKRLLASLAETGTVGTGFVSRIPEKDLGLFVDTAGTIDTPIARLFHALVSRRPRAVAFETNGGFDVLKVVERDVRAAGPGEVRIRVKAAAVNPTDLLMRELGAGDVPRPWVAGMDAAGVIESAGPGVDRLRVGDRVMAACNPRRPEGGAQSELLVVPAASVVAMPAGVRFAEASTLPMNGLTALLGLREMALTAGQTLAVSGGAGLLAHYAIVLAKQRGLRVIADAKPADVERVKRSGADFVIPRGDQFADEVRKIAPLGADALFDTAMLHERGSEAVKDGGSHVVVRGTASLPRGWSPPRGITLHPILVSTVLERTDWLEQLRDLVASGGLTLEVAGEYPPERAADAQRAMAAGGLRGRAVIVF